MRKLMLLALAGAGTLLLSTVGVSSAQTASAGTPIPVKFVCGVERPNPNLTPPAEPPVKPGNYATVINIENLTTDSDGASVPVTISWNVSLPGLSAPASGASITGLGEFTTADITCAQIASAIKTVATNGFITGYVNIVPVPPTASTFANVAVTAVYTSQGCTFPIIGSLIPGLGCSGAVSIDVVPARLEAAAFAATD
jgi:hypothetical protein